MTAMMKAADFLARGRIELADKPMPNMGPNDALRRIPTTICGTAVHLLKGEYPVGVRVTHQSKLDNIALVRELFARQRDGLLKFAIKLC